jgi:hypothetical protein
VKNILLLPLEDRVFAAAAIVGHDADNLKMAGAMLPGHELGERLTLIGEDLKLLQQLMTRYAEARRT